MRIPVALVLLATLACSDDRTPTSPTVREPRPMLQPALVEAVDAKVRNGTDRAAVIDGQRWIGDELVTLEVANDGGPGRFVAEFWGPGPGDAPVLWLTSFPTNVNGGAVERLTWQIEVRSRPEGSPPRVQWIVIRTQQPSLAWPETSRFTITNWPQ